MTFKSPTVFKTAVLFGISLQFLHSFFLFHSWQLCQSFFQPKLFFSQLSKVYLLGKTVSKLISRPLAQIFSPGQTVAKQLQDKYEFFTCVLSAVTLTSLHPEQIYIHSRLVLIWQYKQLGHFYNWLCVHSSTLKISSSHFLLLSTLTCPVECASLY